MMKSTPVAPPPSGFPPPPPFVNFLLSNSLPMSRGSLSLSSTSRPAPFEDNEFLCLKKVQLKILPLCSQGSSVFFLYSPPSSPLAKTRGDQNSTTGSQRNIAHCRATTSFIQSQRIEQQSLLRHIIKQKTIMKSMFCMFTNKDCDNVPLAHLCPMQEQNQLFSAFHRPT